jgi:diadenylate cyclase
VPGLDHVVTRRVERLAREIAREGREGKPVGCFFVVADPDEITGLTHQLIVNPFLGYPREERNVLDPSLEETIKEFSKIDGAFVIARDGTVESAGTYIAVNPQQLAHRPGEGTRHASARAVTSVSEAIAVVVSESTGRVSIYARGNLVG